MVNLAESDVVWRHGNMTQVVYKLPLPKGNFTAVLKHAM